MPVALRPRGKTVIALQQVGLLRAVLACTGSTSGLVHRIICVDTRPRATGVGTSGRARPILAYACPCDNWRPDLYPLAVYCILHVKNILHFLIGSSDDNWIAHYSTCDIPGSCGILGKILVGSTRKNAWALPVLSTGGIRIPPTENTSDTFLTGTGVPLSIGCHPSTNIRRL